MIMGYFPNGTAGTMYYDKWCTRCLHDNMDKDVHCPVWTAHLITNYDECNKADSILHMLIPRDKDGWNQRCLMFVDRGLLSNLAIEKYEYENGRPIIGRVPTAKAPA